METRVGARLLDRGPRGVVLAAEGRRFTAYAENALELWDDYRAGTSDQAGLTGDLRMFATVTACQALLPDLLAPLRAAHPQIRLDLRTGDAAAALARLDEGEVDAAVAGIPKRLPQSLVSRTVAVTDLVLGKAHDSEPDGPYVVPRLVLDSSAVRDRLVEVPAELDPLTIGLCARRTDLRRPLVAALWSLTESGARTGPDRCAGEEFGGE